MHLSFLPEKLRKNKKKRKKTLGSTPWTPNPPGSLSPSIQLSSYLTALDHLGLCWPCWGCPTMGYAKNQPMVRKEETTKTSKTSDPFYSFIFLLFEPGQTTRDKSKHTSVTRSPASISPASICPSPELSSLDLAPSAWNGVVSMALGWDIQKPPMPKGHPSISGSRHLGLWHEWMKEIRVLSRPSSPFSLRPRKTKRGFLLLKPNALFAHWNNNGQLLSLQRTTWRYRSKALRSPVPACRWRSLKVERRCSGFPRRLRGLALAVFLWKIMEKVDQSYQSLLCFCRYSILEP